MSERSVEDEIIAEARHFGRALMAAASQHGRVVSWLDQRRIRKEISRSLREGRRAEQLAREQELANTERMVARYREHARAVDQRSRYFTTDGDQRARDAAAVQRHSDDLRRRFLASTRLTPIERGIALDGLDAATADPNTPPHRRLFAGAQKVKGLDALRYRATIERTRRDLDRRQQTQQRSERPKRFQARMDWTTPGQDPIVEIRQGNDARSMLEGALREVNHGVWGSDTELRVRVRDNARRDGEQIIYDRAGDPRAVGRQLEKSLGVVRDRDGEVIQDPALGFFADEDELREHQAERVQADSQATDAARLAEVEKALREMREDRDRLMSKVTVLQRGVDAVTKSRDDMRGQLDAAEGRIAELQNRNQRLAAEIDQVRRDRPDIDAVTAERDRLRGERDEAVAKLAERTAPADRLGSPERVATSLNPRPGDPLTNGHTRPGHNGIERNR